MIGFFINAALCALNVWAYAEAGKPVSLAVAVFCALCGVFCAVISR